MPCKTCGKDCKCLRMMSKRSCGTRSCDADCPCSCNTRTESRGTAQGQGGQQQSDGSDGCQQTECGQSGGGCGCAGGDDGTIVGCGDSCRC